MVVLLGVLGGAAAFALAAGSAPPAPRILSHPVDRTRARPATFTFTDARPNVTFVCSLDGRRYTACTSPKRYGVLAHGHHVFRVRARSSSGALSDPARYSWKIDLAAPNVKVNFPARRGTYGATAWRTSCQRRRGGICGTVFAPSGVHTVILWIKQNSTQRWFNGHAFKARHAIWKRAILSRRPHSHKRLTRARWFYRLSLPKPDGSYTVLVRATDRIGNLTRLRTQKRVSWTIDTSSLPTPTITSTPANPTSQTTAGFAFADAVASGVAFQCDLDHRGWQTCTTPITYGALSPGAHTFGVRATQGSRVSAPAQYAWSVTSPTGGPFTIRSSTIAPLYPGAAGRTIALTLANPNSSSITVTNLTIGLDPSSLPAGCPIGGYKITQPSIPSTGVTVPTKGSVTLPAQGATTGSIQMLDTHTNQDACKSGQLKLDYSGSAHS
jgi:large repetitive protein